MKNTKSHESINRRIPTRLSENRNYINADVLSSFAGFSLNREERVTDTISTVDFA